MPPILPLNTTFCLAPPDVCCEAYRLGDSALEAVHKMLQMVLERLREAGVTELIAQPSIHQAA
jgi:hypothetical protein